MKRTILYLALGMSVLILATGAQAQSNFTCPSGYSHCVNIIIGTPNQDCVSGTITCYYKYYRASTSGGPYTLINSSPTLATNYVDATASMVVGTKFFYVVTSYLPSTGLESAYSNEASAVIPLGPPQIQTTVK